MFRPARIAAPLLLAASAAMAQPISDAELIEQLWREPGAAAAWFSPAFLSQVPLAEFVPVIFELRESCGEAISVNAAEGASRYVLETTACEMPISITRDSAGLVVGLFLEPPTPLDATLDTMLIEVRALAPLASYVVMVDGAPVAEHQPEKALAVGSAFKLIVLAALRERIETGDADWSDVIRLDRRLASQPSGRLQSWPDRAPLTLQTVATLMISESDNTATDALIHYLGRDVLEKVSGLAPLLTTREFFQLKGDQPLASAYANADTAGKRAILAELATASLPPLETALGPSLPQVEWTLSARSLCDWMARVADLPLMSVNAGALRPADWRRVAYKGGGETGVLNMTTEAIAPDGRRICVSMTWNDIDPQRADPAYRLHAGVLNILRNAP